MKKVYITYYVLGLLMLASSVFAQDSQQKNESRQNSSQKDMSFLKASISLGGAGFNYKLNESLNEKGTTDLRLGWGVHAEYNYYLSDKFALGTGLSLSHYAPYTKFKGEITSDKFYNLGKQYDDDDISGGPRNYELRARVANVQEKHSVYFLEIPLKAIYQTYFNDNKDWGFYGEFGAKALFPVSSRFKLQDMNNTQLNVSGYYKDIDIDFGAPGLPPVNQHGFATEDGLENRLANNKGNTDLKLNFALTAEIGILKELSDDMDLTLGAFIDYGLTDTKKGEKGLFSPPENYLPNARHKVGEGITYNGMINSDIVKSVKPISFGIKIGLRFRMGN